MPAATGAAICGPGGEGVGDRAGGAATKRDGVGASAAAAHNAGRRKRRSHRWDPSGGGRVFAPGRWSGRGDESACPESTSPKAIGADCVRALWGA